MSGAHVVATVAGVERASSPGGMMPVSGGDTAVDGNVVIATFSAGGLRFAATADVRRVPRADALPLPAAVSAVRALAAPAAVGATPAAMSAPLAVVAVGTAADMWLADAPLAMAGVGGRNANVLPADACRARALFNASFNGVLASSWPETIFRRSNQCLGGSSMIKGPMIDLIWPSSLFASGCQFSVKLSHPTDKALTYK